MQNNIASLKRQLEQLKELHDAGALPQAHYEENKAKLERRVLDLVLAGAPDTPIAAPAQTGRKPSRRLWTAVSVAVLAIAAAGYWWTGSPSQIGVGPTANSAANTGEAPAGPSHGTNYDQIAAMTERLAARMKDEPQNAQGWAMLARSYAVLGRHADALAAYKEAIALKQDDADLLADYADSLAVSGKGLRGEPMKWVDRALKLDPRNLKALSLAASEAFERKDYATAVKHWDKVVQAGPAGNELVTQAQANLAEARALAGMPEAPASKAAAASTASISGTVSLAPALRQQVSPQDTVFIYARAAEGSRMPLAILRKQVRDLPVRFTLDDSTAMSPTGKLSSASRVIVSARVSKSGDAMPQAGDLAGQSAAVALGARDLAIEINEKVQSK